MAGWKKKLRYSEETLWFLECYICWIGIGTCDEETSSVVVSNEKKEQQQMTIKMPCNYCLDCR